MKRADRREKRSDWGRSRDSKRYQFRRGLSRKLLLGVLGGLVLGSFGIFGLYLYAMRDLPPSVKLEAALRWMNKGEISTAARIAEAIPPTSLEKRTDKSTRAFLLGVEARTKVQGIEQYKVRVQLNEEAEKHLKQSRDLSFPPGFAGVGNYHLGMALYELFKWNEAVEPLQIAYERYPIGRVDALECLVDIDLSREKQDPRGALARIAHWRSLPASGDLNSQRADIKEIQVMIASNKHREAIELGRRIPVDSSLRPKCDQLLGKAYRELAAKQKGLNSTDAKNGLLDKAKEHLQDCIKSTLTTVPVRRLANLELGLVQRDLGQLTDAISTFSMLRLSSPFEPEGLLAGIEELDALIQTGRFKEVITTLDQINNLLFDLKVFDTDALPLSVVRDRLLKMGNELIDRKAYPVAEAFIQRLPNVCNPLDRLKLSSRNDNDWALELESDPTAESQRLEHYRKSGAAYRELTRKLPLDDQYDEWLWMAIENFRKGHAYKESNEALNQYLAHESRDNRPKGHLIRARNFMALENPAEAVNSLMQIVDSNLKSPLIYEARYELAKIKSLSQKYGEAEQLLLENLSGDLQPSSAIWRESLYTLGSMLFDLGEKMLIDAKNTIELNPSQTLKNLSQIEVAHNTLKKSIVRIEDFLRRFDKDDRRFHLLYKIAKGYQLASYWPEIQLRENTAASEDSIENLKSQRKADLINSRNSYKRLRQEITQDNVRDPKSASQKELLRNSYFGEADLYFYDGAYEDAMAAYLEAANWFVNEPEALEARKQIAVCLKHLGKYADSRRSIEYARSMLQRMPTDKDDRFRMTTAMDRAGWEAYLNSMLEELDKLEGRKP